MACDNILYFEQDDCATNYAGVTSEMMIVPFSPNLEAGIHNRKILSEWNADNHSLNASGKSFKSLRLPAYKGGEDDQDEVILKGGVRVEIDPLKSSYSSPSQGPKRGKMFTNELKVKLIGRSLDDIDFLMSLTMSNQFGVVFKDANGNYRLLADLDYPVDAQVSDESGEGPAAEAAASITFSNTATHPAFFFRGRLAYGVSFDSKDSTKIIDCMSGLDIEENSEIFQENI